MATATLAVAGVAPWPGLDLRLAAAAALWFAALAVVTVTSLGAERASAGYLAAPRTRYGRALWAATVACLLGDAIVAGGGALRSALEQTTAALGGASIAGAGAPWSLRIGAGLLALGVAALGAMAVPGVAAASTALGGALLLGLLLLLATTGGMPVAGPPSSWAAAVLPLSVLGGLWVVTAMAPALAPPHRRTVAAAAVAYGGGAALGLVALPGLAESGTGLRALVASAALLAAAIAMHHRMVAGYGIAAALERSGLLPRGLVERSARLGTPFRLLLLLGLLSGAVALLLAPEQAFSVAAVLGAAGLLLFSGSTWVRAMAERQLLRAVAALIAALGAAVVLAAVLWHALAIALAALAAAAAAAVAAVLWHRLRGQLPHLRAATAERAAAESPSGVPILTLHEALEVAPRYRPRVLLATLEGSRSLIERGVLRAGDDDTLLVLYVDQIPGMFYPPQVAASARAVEILLETCSALDARGLQGIPIWRVAHDPAASIAQAARTLGVERVIVDVPERAPLREVFRGQTLGRLRKLLGRISLEVVRPGVQEEAADA